MTEEFKHKIVIQSLSSIIDENGFEVEEWDDFICCYAKVENLRGKEFFEAAVIQAESTVKFTIRYVNGIDESMRITFRDKNYRITFIDNVNYENRYMEIKALEVEQSG
jgi:SPP1 family predicted phage head-tail adaptor